MCVNCVVASLFETYVAEQTTDNAPQSDLSDYGALLYLVSRQLQQHLNEIGIHNDLDLCLFAVGYWHNQQLAVALPPLAQLLTSAQAQRLCDYLTALGYRQTQCHTLLAAKELLTLSPTGMQQPCPAHLDNPCYQLLYLARKRLHSRTHICTNTCNVNTINNSSDDNLPSAFYGEAYGHWLNNQWPAQIFINVFSAVS